jgi:hypothetical protein
MKPAILLTNGTLLTPLRAIPHGAILVEGDRIREFGPAEAFSFPENVQVVDVRGASGRRANLLPNAEVHPEIESVSPKPDWIPDNLRGAAGAEEKNYHHSAKRNE